MSDYTFDDVIDYIKCNTDLCNTYSCYENCEQCVCNFIIDALGGKKDVL